MPNPTRSSLAQACRAIANFLGDTIAEDCREADFAAQLMPYLKAVAEAAWEQGFNYGREHCPQAPIDRRNPYND